MGILTPLDTHLILQKSGFYSFENARESFSNFIFFYLKKLVETICDHFGEATPSDGLL